MASAGPVLIKIGGQYWMRLSVTNQICVKEALLDILHDPVTGVSKNEQNFYQMLVVFKANEKRNLRGVIKPFQWQILCHVCDVNCSTPCPNNGNTDSNDLDITCIIVLIIHLTTLPPPLGRSGWKQTQPQQGDHSVAAFVLLARDLRNRLSHCSLADFETKADFDKEWNGMKAILLGLGYKNMQLFHQLEHAPLDPYLNHQVQTLKDAVANLVNVEINNLKFLIDEVDQKVGATNNLLRNEIHDIALKMNQFDQRITINEQINEKQDEQILHLLQQEKKHDEHIQKHDEDIQEHDEHIQKHDRDIQEIQSQLQKQNVIRTEGNLRLIELMERGSFLRTFANFLI